LGAAGHSDSTAEAPPRGLKRIGFEPATSDPLADYNKLSWDSHQVTSSLILTLVKVYQQFEIEDLSIPADFHIKVLFDLLPFCRGGSMVVPLLLRGELHKNASSLALDSNIEFHVEKMIQHAETLWSRVKTEMNLVNDGGSINFNNRKELINDLKINACQLQIHINTVELKVLVISLRRLIKPMQHATRDDVIEFIHCTDRNKNNVIL